MKKTIQINLAGRNFNIDEDAYQLLQKYLDSLSNYFIKDEESGKEIIDDIEYRIAELFDEKISSKKQVISITDVDEAIKTLGKIEDFEFEQNGNITENKNEKYYEKRTRSLYRYPEKSIFGGVCSGLGAYFNVEPWIFRIIFIFLLLVNFSIHIFFGFMGISAIIYIVLWIALPKAVTTTQKLEMKGEPVNLRNIQRSVNEEFDKVKSNFKNFKNADNVERMKNAFTEVIETIGHLIGNIFKALGSIIAVVFIIIGVFLLINLAFPIISKNWPNIHLNLSHINLSNLSPIFENPTLQIVLIVCAAIILTILILSIILGFFRMIFNIKGNNNIFKSIASTSFMLIIIVVLFMIITDEEPFLFHSAKSKNYSIKTIKNKPLYLDVKKNDNFIENYSVFSVIGYNYFFDQYDNSILGDVKLTISQSDSNVITLAIKKSLRFTIMKDAAYMIDHVDYDWHQLDTIIYFDEFFSIDKDFRWRFPKVELELKIPENKIIYLSKDMEKILCTRNEIEKVEPTNEIVGGKTWIMTVDGLKHYPIEDSI